MRRINVLFGIAAACFALSACGSQTAGSAEGIDVPAVVDAGGVKFDMVAVEGGSFAMGKTPAGTKIADVTIHEVVLDGFSISGKPVSRQLWEAVMNEQRGSSTSHEAPVDMVSQDDCKKFLSKLSKMTGIPFALPTEAQWEYAVSQGLVEVPAKFEEWCADSYQPLTSNELVHNPFCAEKRDAKVVRTAIKRNEEVNYIRKPALGFRVVANTKTEVPQDIIDAIIDHKVTREDKSEAEVIEVGNVKYRMVPVKGGSFDMGATAEQSAKAAGEDEKPVHKVALKSFEIGQTEVTVGLWQAVMGSIPYSNDAKFSEKPVVNVSWYDCQRFIVKLNRLTGRKFRLPTEAEWEFACRAGLEGPANADVDWTQEGADSIAWNTHNATNVIDGVATRVAHRVGSKAPNAWGLYDMLGNAWECTRDIYLDALPFAATFGGKGVSEPVVDPVVLKADGGTKRVRRGGAYNEVWNANRASARGGGMGRKDTWVGYRVRCDASF